MWRMTATPRSPPRSRPPAAPPADDGGPRLFSGSGTWARRSRRYWLRAAGIGEDVIGGRASLAAEDGERRNFHRSARTLPAARGHAGPVSHRHDTTGHSTGQASPVVLFPAAWRGTAPGCWSSRTGSAQEVRGLNPHSARRTPTPRPPAAVQGVDRLPAATAKAPLPGRSKAQRRPRHQEAQARE
jgi:hypothetical protein